MLQGRSCHTIVAQYCCRSDVSTVFVWQRWERCLSLPMRSSSMEVWWYRGFRTNCLAWYAISCVACSLGFSGQSRSHLSAAHVASFSTTVRGWGLMCGCSRFPSNPLVKGVLALGCRVWGSGFRAWGLGFGVWSLGFRVQDSPSNPLIIIPFFLMFSFNKKTTQTKRGKGCKRVLLGYLVSEKTLNPDPVRDPPLNHPI